MEPFNVKKRTRIEKMNSDEYENHVREVRDLVSSTQTTKTIDRMNLHMVLFLEFSTVGTVFLSANVLLFGQRGSPQDGHV